MTTWTEALTKFERALPGFKRRENQDALALRIERSLTEGTHLFAQASTGTGKSFAGAIPAIGKAKADGRPVILATATKALQDQLAVKDLPFLQETLGDFTFAVVKGRGNYVCRQKVDELTDTYVKSEVAAAIEAEGFSGEIADLEDVSDQTKASLSTSSDDCPGKSECPFGKICFAEIAKDKARQSDVVVANHAVLAVDLAIRAAQRAMDIPEEKITAILPKFSAVVVDEAHEFVDFVTNALGGDLTAGSISRLNTEVANLLGSRDVLASVIKANDELFALVAKLIAGREDKRSKTALISDRNRTVFTELATELYRALTALRGKVALHVIHGDDKAAQKKKRLLKRMENMGTKVLALATLRSDTLVTWLEVGEGKRGDSINWAPLSVADFLADELLATVPVTFMSATLAVGGDFSPLASQLGVEEYDTFDAGTPFDYRKQALTFVPQLPHPAGSSAGQWRTSSIATMKELVSASDGRALLLFTSRLEMEEAYSALSTSIRKMGHTVLKQGDDTNKKLAAIFAADEHSVLFAMKSFFTGIDIQGDSLRLVIINKLPFVNPSDVIFKARTDAIDAKYGPWKGFNKLAVPTMAMSLMQAYGRLIRTVNDSGCVAILDSRLYGKTAKPYGAKIMKSLPDAPVTTQLSEAVSFLESLEA